MSDPAPTIYTVAERAGVSVATVSRVLQGNPATSEAARQRVQQAVAELGYAPLRRSRGRVQTHGVVVPNLAERGYADLLLGVQSGTHGEAGASRMVLACDDIGEIGAVDEVLTSFAEHTDGLIVCDSTASDAQIDALAAHQPVVLVGRPAIDGCDLLEVDHYSPMSELVTGLLALGLRRMVFLGDPDANQSVGLRHAALVSSLAANGLTEALPAITVPTDESGADRGLGVLLGARDQVDVVICASDELALRLMHILVWKQVSVPDDLAVVGWGGLAAADYVVPRLTTVHDPLRELGALAAARLRERLAGEPVGEPTVLRPEVCWRESTGRPG